VGGCVAGGAAAGRLDVPTVEQQCIAVEVDDSTHALQIMLVFMYMRLGTVVTDLQHVCVPSAVSFAAVAAKVRLPPTTTPETATDGISLCCPAERWSQGHR
jgi:hypothetical protein